MRRILHRLTVLVLALSLSGAIPAGAATRLTSISFANSTTGIITGVNTTGPSFISQTSDGGQSFSPSLLAPGGWFVGGDIAGTRAIGVETFGRFPVVTTNAPSGWATATAFTAADEPDPNAAAVLSGGRLAIVGQITNYQSSSRGDVALLTTSDDNGASWTQRYLGPFYPAPTDPVTGDVTGDPPRTKSNLWAIDADPTGMTAWVVGQESKESGIGYTPQPPLIRKTVDGGSNWATQTVTPVAGYPTTVGALRAVAAGSATQAYAAGSNRMFVRTTDANGSVWSRSDIPTDTSVSITYSRMNALAMDAVGSTVVVAGQSGKIAWTTNATAATPTWTFYNLPSRATLRGAAVIDANTWMVVGDNETVVRTTNAGATWAVSAAQPPGVSITGPASGFMLGSTPITFNGTSADAGSGVASTEIRIRRADGRSWDGTGFQVTDKWLPVESTDGFKTWSYTWGGDPALHAAGQLVTVEARATDAIGLVGMSTGIVNGAPIVGSVNLAGGASYTSAPSVTAAVSAAGATHMRYRVNGAEWPTTWLPYATSTTVGLGEPDGLKTVDFQFSRDGGLSVAGSASDSITLHRSTPTISMTSPTADFTPAGSVQIAGSASDVGGSVTGVHVRIRRADAQFWNGSAWTGTETWLPATSANGYASWTYTWNAPALLQAVSVTARATDMAGLTTLTPIVNSASPAGPSVMLEGGAATTTDTAILASVSAPGATHMRWAINATPAGAWSPIAASVPVTLPAGDGVKTVNFDFTSNPAGSTAETSASDTIVLHTSIPAVAMTSPAEGFVTTTSAITIAGTASDAGGWVSSVAVRIRRSDGRTWSGTAWEEAENWVPASSANAFANWTLSWTPDAEFLASGQMVSLSARAIDAAGLSAITADRSSTVAVSGQISIANGAPYTASAEVPVAITASGATHMRWRVDGGAANAWRPVSTVATVTLGTGEGVKTVTFDFSADGINPAASAADTIIRDVTAPTATFTAPAAGFTYDLAPVLISGTASDVQSGVARVQVRLRQGTDRFWSGSALTGWLAEEQWLDATLVGGSWSYSWQPDDSVRLNGTPVTVDVRVVDGAGSATTTSRVSAYHKTLTSLTLTSSSAVLAYGAYGYVRGNLSVHGQPMSNATVVLYAGSSSTSLARTSLTATTDLLGNFSIRVKPSSKTYYRVNYLGAATREASNSGTPIAYTPKVYLTTPSGPTTVGRTSYYTYVGYLKPRHTAGTTPVRIYVERLSGGTYNVYRYYTAKASNYSSYTKYTGRVRLPYAGKWRIRAYHADTGHAATYTSYRYVTSR